jgi:cell division transport system permease protein
MKFLKLWRTFKEGGKNFYRNGWLTFATVSVLAISLYVVCLTTLLALGTNEIINSVKEKINIIVYFKSEVSEERIVSVKKDLSAYNKEIKEVKYVSKHQALDEFLKSSGDDPAIIQALEEIGENPLLASLIIKANNPEDYDLINQAISRSDFRDNISKINYEANKTSIEKLNNFLVLTQKIGLIISAIFMVVAVLVTFNTIRLTIYARRKEFEIMRLVGASNLYIRVPCVFEGIFYGLASSFISLILAFFTIQFIAPMVQEAVSKEVVVSFYFQYFALLALIVILGGIILGMVSSLIAIRRYLKI